MESKAVAKKIAANEQSVNVMFERLGWDNPEDRATVFDILAKQLGYEIQG